eukprot:Em0006g2a
MSLINLTVTGAYKTHIPWTVIQVETCLTFSLLFSKIVAGAHPRLVVDEELSHSSLDEVHIGLTLSIVDEQLNVDDVCAMFACDLSVTSPLNSKILFEAGVTAGAAAHATELRKHEANDAKCSDLGWVCIPLVVESYGAWGKEALEAFSMLASRLATSSSRPKSMVLSELYGRLNLHLVRANTGPAFCPFHLPHASSWLSVVPSEGLGLHLNPDQFQVAIKWWLGLDTSGGSLCSLCPDTVLDSLGHHASTCKRGGDAVFRHNRLRDVVAESCILAHLSVKVEAENNLTPDHSHTRPADVLVQNWSRGRPAAFDICVTSPLNTLTLSEAGVCAGAAAQAGEVRKHSANDDKCGDLGWFCVPLVTETYGAWGPEAKACFSQLASRLPSGFKSPNQSFFMNYMVA